MTAQRCHHLTAGQTHMTAQGLAGQRPRTVTWPAGGSGRRSVIDYASADSPFTEDDRGSIVTALRLVVDVLDRHGADSPNARAHADRGPYLFQVEARVLSRLP